MLSFEELIKILDKLLAKADEKRQEELIRR